METKTKNGNTLFPIFLKLDTLKVLVVGGGKVGLEKISALLGNSPETEITLVAPEILPAIEEIAFLHPNVKLKRRVFFTGDLYNADLVVVATGDRNLNQAIKAEAHKQKILVNVADTPELCDFYLGAVVKKGDLKIAISTNGKSPTLAKRVKEILNDAFPDQIQQVLDNLQHIRKKLNGNFSAKVKKLNEITSVLTVD
jgi:siroheme synthase-like protein